MDNHPKRNGTTARSPEWETVLTESLRRNCVAPSEETILHAFDLYSRDFYAPLQAREHEMAGRYSRIIAGFSHLQALIPHMIERAMARNPWEFAHIIDHRPEEGR